MLMVSKVMGWKSHRRVMNHPDVYSPFNRMGELQLAQQIKCMKKKVFKK